MKVKEIEICFENCETCKLQPNMFKYLIIEGIYKDKSVNCYQYEDGEMEEMLCCKYFHIEINEKGLNQKFYWTEQTLKERLDLFGDITSIILYTEEDEEEIYVPWREIDAYENNYQVNTYVEETGIMAIEIKEEQ